MKLLLILLTICGCAVAQEKKRDLSKVTDTDIIKTVEHLRQLVNEGEKENVGLRLKAIQIVQELGQAKAAQKEAKEETAKVQGAYDQKERELAASKQDTIDMTKHRDAERKAKWFWFKWCIGTWVLVAAFFVARQYLPFLKAL